MCVYLDVWMPILHLNLSLRALRFHGRFRNPFVFTYSPMALRRVRDFFLLVGCKANVNTRRVVARAGSDCFFGLELDSVRPCIQTRDLWSICKNKRVLGGGREGRGGRGDGRYPTPKNMGALMPAVKSRCWRQNLKVVAQKNTNTFLRQRAMALRLRMPGAR